MCPICDLMLFLHRVFSFPTPLLQLTHQTTTALTESIIKVSFLNPVIHYFGFLKSDTAL